MLSDLQDFPLPIFMHRMYDCVFRVLRECAFTCCVLLMVLSLVKVGFSLCELYVRFVWLIFRPGFPLGFFCGFFL